MPREMKKENEEKKEYLNQYRNIKKKIKNLEDEKKELTSNQKLSDVIISDMPRAHNQKNLSDYASMLDGKVSEYISCKYKLVKLCTEIRWKLEELAVHEERTVLINRYILGKHWEVIADKMGYSVRHITRLHGNALKNFKI